MNDCFEIRKSSIEGVGAFATAEIPKGQVICTFQGTRLSIPQLKEKYALGEERSDDPLQIEDSSYLDLDEPYVFFNHSCEPNAGMRGLGTLFALRDIAQSEEITYDYSTTEWSDDVAWGVNWAELWRVPCHCGSVTCRGEMSGCYLLPEERKRYYLAQGALMDFIVPKVKAEFEQK